MTISATTNIPRDIADFIAIAAQLPEDEVLDEDADLVGLGLMTSLITTELLAYVSRKYDVAIGMDKITAKNFATPDAIADLIETYQEEI